MVLNDTFTIQEINLDKKDLSFDNKLKKIEAYWNNECIEHPSNNHCKIFYGVMSLLLLGGFAYITFKIKR